MELLAKRLMADDWYYRLLGEEFGPISHEMLKRSIRIGELTENDEVRESTSAAWITVREFLADGLAGGVRAKRRGPTLLMGSASDDQSGTLVVPRVESDHSTVNRWYCQSPRLQRGPYLFDELITLARSGQLTPDDQIQLSEHGAWRRAGSMGRLMAEMPFRDVKSLLPTGSADQADDELESSVPFRESAPTPARAGTPAANSSQRSSVAPSPEQDWFVKLNGVDCGPMQLAQLVELARSGRLLPQDLLKHGATSEWIAAQTVPGLIAGSGVSAQPNSSVPAKPTATKSASLPAAAQPAAKPPAAAAPPSSTSAAQKATDSQISAVTAVAPPVAPPPPPAVPYRPPQRFPSPAIKKPTPAKKKSSSAGGGLTVGVLLANPAVKIGLASMAVMAVLVLGWFLWPESTAKFREPYQKLSKIAKSLEDQLAAKPAPTQWKTFSEKTLKDLKDVERQLNALNSRHPVRDRLRSGISGLRSAAMVSELDEATGKMKQINSNLSEAKKRMGI